MDLKLLLVFSALKNYSYITTYTTFSLYTEYIIK